MENIDNNTIISVAKDAAVEAGKYLLSQFGKVNGIIVKGDRNLATNADKTAEKMIVEKIMRVFPEHNIMGEEDDYQQKKSDFLWIIDPLDGTHNFIKGINIFGVSIGLWYCDRFIAGVIYMPVDDELYYAYEGLGAWKNGRRISVSQISDMKEASCSFDSSIRLLPETMLDLLGAVSCASFNVRMFGSSVRLLTYVAEGVIDYAIEFHDRPWDFAGAVALIVEAGGEFRGLRAQSPTPETVGYVASNKYLYRVLNDMVTGCIEKRRK